MVYLVFAVANMDAILSGADVSKIYFNGKLLRSYLVKSLIKNDLEFPHSRCKYRGNARVYVMNKTH